MIEIQTTADGCKVSGSLSRFDPLDQLMLPTSEQQRLQLDLSELESIDTAGLAWLLKIKYQLAAKQQSLVCQNPSEKLIKLASISGVNDILGI